MQKEELYISYITKDVSVSGTSTSDAEFKLIDAGALFLTGATPISKGDLITNTSNNRTAKVVTADSDTQLTLNKDIFPVGSSPVNYKINKLINERIELLKSLNPNITFNIAEIAKPDQRKTDYSKTIKLPASKKIRKVFENIFEVNIDLQTFNPNLKTNVLYLVDGEINIDGYLQLKKVNILDNDDVEFECTIIGRIGNFIVDLGAKELTDLDFTSLNHIYNKTNQEATWNYPLTTDYVYPMINYDINYGTQGFTEGWDVEDFFPAITVKKYIDNIFEDAGYTYTSDFFNSTYFENLIIPFSSKNFALTESSINDRIFEANTPLFNSTGTDTISFDGLTDTILDDPIDLMSLGYTFSTKNTNEIYDAGLVHDPTTGIYTVNQDGYFNIEAAYDFEFTITTPTTAISPIYNITELYGWLQINKYDSLGNFVSTLDEVGIGISYDTDQPLLPNGVTYTSNTLPTSQWFKNPDVYYASNVSPFPSGYLADDSLLSRNYSPVNRYHTSCSNVFLEVGEQIKIEVTSALYGEFPRPTGGAANFRDTPSPGFGNTFIDGGTFDLKILNGYFKNSVVNSGYVESNPIDMNGAIPLKVKQKDFFMSLVKMFNLYVQADTSDDSNLFIEPRDDFYNDVINDWSEKLDISKELEFLPMGALDSREYLFTYKQDKDYYNKLYEETWEDIYGEREKIIENDFINNEHKTELIFSPTPSVGQEWYDRVIPTIIKFDNKNGVQRTEANIRILQWAGLKDTQAVWTYEDNSGVFDLRDQYPYAGMYDDPYTPTEDIAFGLTNEIFWSAVFGNSITWTNNNLYNKYYKKFIEEITDINSKIVKGWFYLRPSDIRNLSFREVYYFDGAYFRLNKIENYNPSNPITKCEFLKLKEANPFVPDTTTATGGVDEKLGDEDVPKFIDGSARLKNNNSIGNKNHYVAGENNYISRSSANVDIKGNDNKVYSNSFNITIQGDNNIIRSGVENVFLLNSNNQEIGESNITIINNEIRGAGSIQQIDTSITADEKISTYLVNTSSGAVTITFPSDATIGKIWNVKVLDNTNECILATVGTETIDGYTDIKIEQVNTTISIQWDGSNYKII